jgi:hypothetical protein
MVSGNALTLRCCFRGHRTGQQQCQIRSGTTLQFHRPRVLLQVFLRAAPEAQSEFFCSEYSTIGERPELGPGRRLADIFYE